MSVKNGNGRQGGNGKVRVAIVGVGNCASSLIQDVQYYNDASPKEEERSQSSVTTQGQAP